MTGGGDPAMDPEAAHTFNGVLPNASVACPALGSDGPSGSSGFADDANCHTGGPDAIPAMRVIVQIIGPIYLWLGKFFNMKKKSLISAIDRSTGLAMPTDSTLAPVLQTSIPVGGKPGSEPALQCTYKRLLN